MVVLKNAAKSKLAVVSTTALARVWMLILNRLSVERLCAGSSQDSGHRCGPDSRLGLCVTLIRDAAGGEPDSLGQRQWQKMPEHRKG